MNVCRLQALSLAALLLVGAPTSSPGAARGRTTTAAAGPRVTLEIRHRVFHDFLERQTVGMGQTSRVGDTEYSFRVAEFIPDFTMNLKTHQVTTRSLEPINPAFRVVVRLKGVPQDTVWAMLKMPPHFARKSLLAFKVLRIEMQGREPIVNPDSLPPPAEKKP